MPFRSHLLRGHSSHCLAVKCVGLTPRSRRAPTATRASPGTAKAIIVRSGAYTLRCRARLTSNVRLRKNPMLQDRSNLLLAGTAVLVALLVWSGLHPYDRATWLMEVAPIFIAVPILFATYRTFPLTSLLYFLIFWHAAVLMLGGTYTYARVPLGFQIADLLGIHRNPYDKIGHFFQGFVPALAAREILHRGGYVKGEKMLAFLVVCVVLAISATYEFIEWGAALALGQGADEFLGTQGDPWDTQSDMFFALLGAISSLVLLSGVHNRQMATVAKSAT
ncbi:putative membrane protein [Burkholderiales bacterium JOSHI_001]|nr:putative membrane protein [Burkholderiales bacterium JOSHI_001]